MNGGLIYKIFNSYLVSLLLILLLSISLRAQFISVDPTIEHDEAISYLSAAGNQGDYAKVVENKIYPYGFWVSVSEWRKFYEVKDAFNFRKIQTDLGDYDAHPPLYFWILHIFVVIFGVHIWVGPLLNLLLHAVNVALLYGFSRAILKENFKSMAVTFTYALSPGVMGVAFIARNYELFTTLSLMFIWSLFVILTKKRNQRVVPFIWVASLVFLGLLNHYYFALFIGGIFFAPIPLYKLFGYGLLRKYSNVYLYIALGSIGGLLLFFLVHPHFIKQLFFFQSQSQSFEFYYFFLRVLKVVLAFVGYLVPVSRTSIPLTSILLLIAFGLIFISAIKNLSRLKILMSIKLNDNVILLYISVIVGFFLFSVIVLYLSFFTHQAVMGPRYLSPIFPFIAFIPVMLLIIGSDEKNKKIIYAFCFIMFISGVLCAKPWATYNNVTKKLFDESHSVLIDTGKRGILLNYIMHIPPGKEIYVSTQNDLLENIDWLDEIVGSSVYLSTQRYGNTIKGREMVINIIKQKYDIALSEGGEWGVWGLGQSYLVLPKQDSGSAAPTE